MSDKKRRRINDSSAQAANKVELVETVQNPNNQEEVKVEMYNDIGQLIFQEVSVITDAGVEYSAEELGLSIGMYTVKVFIGDVSKAIKIVKD